MTIYDKEAMVYGAKIPNRIKIDGEQFELQGWNSVKSKMDFQVDVWRKRGWKARVQKYAATKPSKDTFYAMYLGPKRKR